MAGGGVSTRPEEIALLADAAATLIDRMHADHDRLLEILNGELSDAELLELSDDWYVETDAIVVEDGDDISVYTTLGRVGHL